MYFDKFIIKLKEKEIFGELGSSNKLVNTMHRIIK